MLYHHIVPCVSLSDPENGNMTCSFDASVFQYTCTYYCNRGYQLEGNRQTRVFKVFKQECSNKSVQTRVFKQECSSIQMFAKIATCVGENVT